MSLSAKGKGEQLAEMSTSERLLAAAEQILVERGVTGLSVRKVGDQAGVNPTLVTYHFKSIDNLLAELAHRNLEPILAEWRTIETGMALDDILRNWLLPMRRGASFSAGGRALVVLDEIGAHGRGMPRDQVNDAMESFSRRLRDALQPHCPHLDNGELRARLRFIAGAILGPPPRNRGVPALADGTELDAPAFMLAFARAALAGQGARA